MLCQESSMLLDVAIERARATYDMNHAYVVSASLPT